VVKIINRNERIWNISDTLLETKTCGVWCGCFGVCVCGNKMLTMSNVYNIKASSVQDVHIGTFRFEHPVDSHEWDTFIQTMKKGSGHNFCSTDEVRAFVEKTFDCPTCIEKITKSLGGVDVVSFDELVSDKNKNVHHFTTPDHEPSLRASFDENVDGHWIPLAYDPTPEPFFRDMYANLVSASTLTRDDIETQSKLIRSFVISVVNILHTIHKLSATLAFDLDNGKTCPLLQLVLESTSLLFHLLHSDLKLARENLSKILDVPVNVLPTLTDVCSQYYHMWTQQETTKSDDITRVQDVLFELNRRRILRFRAWYTKTESLRTNPDYTRRIQKAVCLWRYIDNCDFHGGMVRWNERILVTTLFGFVLGKLHSKSSVSAAANDDSIPSVYSEMVLTDAIILHVLNSTLVAYKELFNAHRAQFVPTWFPMTLRLRDEIHGLVRPLEISFAETFDQFQNNIKAMPPVMDRFVTRLNMAQTLIVMSTVLRKSACIIQYIHDVVPILRDTLCANDMPRCMYVLFQKFQYEKLQETYSAYVTEQLLHEIENEEAVPPSKETKKKSKAAKKKKHTVKPSSHTPPTRDVQQQQQQEEQHAQQHLTVPMGTVFFHNTTTEVDFVDDWEVVSKTRTSSVHTNTGRKKKAVQTSPTVVPTVMQTSPPVVPTVVQTSPTVVPTVVQTSPTVMQTSPTVVPTVVQTSPTVVPTVEQTSPMVMQTSPTIVQTSPPVVPTVVQSVPPVVPTVVQKVSSVPVSTSAKKRQSRSRQRRNREQQTGGPSQLQEEYPNYSSVPGYDPSMFYMQRPADTSPFAYNQHAQAYSLALVSPEMGTIAYGQFVPEHVMYAPFRYF
jgi:hypothetical protein